MSGLDVASAEDPRLSSLQLAVSQLETALQHADDADATLLGAKIDEALQLAIKQVENSSGHSNEGSQQ